MLDIIFGNLYIPPNIICISSFMNQNKNHFFLNIKICNWAKKLAQMKNYSK